jgi:hypothetical protein
MRKVPAATFGVKSGINLIALQLTFFLYLHLQTIVIQHDMGVVELT